LVQLLADSKRSGAEGTAHWNMFPGHVFILRSAPCYNYDG